jgi:peptidoglycan/LPS O-acetylase OafA/YrhL
MISSRLVTVCVLATCAIVGVVLAKSRPSEARFDPKTLVPGKSGAIHLSGLNALRAIAATGVMLSHLGAGLGFFGGTPLPTLMLAGYGVVIFFALSGFLITFLLLHEAPAVDIRAFYMRRVLRIWPIYFLVLLAAIALVKLFTITSWGPEKPGPVLLFYVFLLANVPFALERSFPFIGHFWSIGVEEQFYLFWPWFFRSKENAPPLSREARMARSRRRVTVFLVAFAALRIVILLVARRHPMPLLEGLFGTNRFDCMAIGSLAAHWVLERNDQFLKIVTWPGFELMGWAMIVLAASNQFQVSAIIDGLLVAILAVALIVNGACNPQRLLSLEREPFKFLGKVSYGIYVYHPMMIFFAAKAWSALSLPSVMRLPFAYSFVVIGTLLVSHLSYQYFEKAFLRIKTRWERVPSSGSRL